LSLYIVCLKIGPRLILFLDELKQFQEKSSLNERRFQVEIKLLPFFIAICHTTDRIILLCK